LITSQRSALPIWLEVLSGNSSDKETFATSIEAYCKQLGESEKPYFVMDSAGYAADNLKNLKEMRWLMRVPETLAEAKRLVRETEQTAMVELTPGYWGKEVENTYGDIPQRWLVVFYPAHWMEKSSKPVRRNTLSSPGRAKTKKTRSLAVVG